jgi:hypothetical protein
MVDRTDAANDGLYSTTQVVLTCSICACRYPATRRRLAREHQTLPVCSERCFAVFQRRSVEQEYEPQQANA